jgi:hypothetical protein
VTRVEELLEQVNAPTPDEQDEQDEQDEFRMRLVFPLSGEGHGQTNSNDPN